jgi:hypothetical protein
MGIMRHGRFIEARHSAEFQRHGFGERCECRRRLDHGLQKTSRGPMLKRSEVTDDDQRNILLKEMDILQKVFDKYDDWIFKLRAGCVTAVLALLSISFSKTQIDLRVLTAFVPLVSWLIEGMIRWDHWYGYVERYLTIGRFLNDARSPEIYIYDLKNYRGNNRRDWRQLLNHATLRSSFGKIEPVVFYLVILFFCLLSLVVPRPA